MSDDGSRLIRPTKSLNLMTVTAMWERVNELNKDGHSSSAHSTLRHNTQHNQCALIALHMKWWGYDFYCVQFNKASDVDHAY